MSKLKQYITEARNIKGDMGKIKKIVKRWEKQVEKLRQKTGDEIEHIIKSVEKNVSDVEFKLFSDTLEDDLMDDELEHNLYKDITFMLHR